MLNTPGSPGPEVVFVEQRARTGSTEKTANKTEAEGSEAQQSLPGMKIAERMASWVDMTGMYMGTRRHMYAHTVGTL